MKISVVDESYGCYHLTNLTFCCDKMMMSIVETQQIKVNGRGNVIILPSKEIVRFCPFCGGKIETTVFNNYTF